MTQVHSLRLEDMHSEVSLTNANSRELGNDHLPRREVSGTFRPILRLMKLSGEFYGDVTVEGNLEKKWSAFSRLYCGLVLLGQWFIVVQAVTSLFFEGLAQMNTFFLLLIFSIWYLPSAVRNKHNLSFHFAQGPEKKPSRLGHSLDNLLAKTCYGGVNACNMYKVYLLLALVCFFAVFNTVCLTLLNLYRNSLIGRFQPWNGLFPYRLIHLIFCACDAFAWSLPFTLFYVSCKISGRFI